MPFLDSGLACSSARRSHVHVELLGEVRAKALYWVRPWNGSVSELHLPCNWPNMHGVGGGRPRCVVIVCAVGLLVAFYANALPTWFVTAISPDMYLPVVVKVAS